MQPAITSHHFRSIVRSFQGVSDKPGQTTGSSSRAKVENHRAPLPFDHDLRSATPAGIPAVGLAMTENAEALQEMTCIRREGSEKVFSTDSDVRVNFSIISCRKVFPYVIQNHRTVSRMPRNATPARGRPRPQIAIARRPHAPEKMPTISKILFFGTNIAFVWFRSTPGAAKIAWSRISNREATLPRVKIRFSERSLKQARKIRERQGIHS